MASQYITQQSGAESHTGLVRALIQHGWISAEAASAIAARIKTNKIPPIESVLAENITGIDAAAMARFCSEAFSHPWLGLEGFNALSIPPDLVDDKIIKQFKVLPLLRRGTELKLAMSDPTDLEAINQVQFVSQCTVEPIVVQHNTLLALITTLQGGTVGQDGISPMMGGNDNLDDEPEPAQMSDTSDVDEAPVVKFLQSILVDASRQGASDIHFEPYERSYRIRYRVDGVLSEVVQAPVNYKERIAARLKIISRIDISEKRVPQDGRTKVKISDTSVIDCRVSTLPTLFGEKIVIRILDSAQAKLGVESLGYDDDQKTILLNAIGRPYGMILVTGPTGSGKTVSLYACLNILNKPGINICTAEDPSEINLPGINQVNINDKAGLTFAAALKAFLRQDPDIIMVGEIRDLETADIAIKAAQTGHLVLSTLHTNDAPGTLTRMLNMGIAPFNIASSVILITGQRLGRRLCVCKKPHALGIAAKASVGYSEADVHADWVPYEPVGCDRCKGTGYKGRVGIYQVMPITQAMQGIILDNGSSLDIERQARLEGVLSLREAGLQKVKQGITSIEEVLAVTNE